MMNLFEVSKEIADRLTRVFTRDYQRPETRVRRNAEVPERPTGATTSSSTNTSTAIMVRDLARAIRPAGPGSWLNLSSSTAFWVPSGSWRWARKPGSGRAPRVPGAGKESSYEPNGELGSLFPEAEAMKLRRETIVTALAALVIAAAIPFAIMDTIETGRVYLFSRQFLEELPRRFTGPGRLRFILQPMFAILLGVRWGIADAKAGHQPYLFGLFFDAGRRRELLRSGAAAVETLLAMGIIMDVVFQLVLYREVHPGAALVVGPILICLPYGLSRALTTGLVRRLGE